MICIKCIGASAACTNKEIITAGMVGKEVQFSFDGAWDGLKKTAVFAGAVRRSCALGDQLTAEIPADVLYAAGSRLQIGVRGEMTDGTVVIPTVYVDCGTIRPGADPTPDGEVEPPSAATYLQSQINTLSRDLLAAQQDIADLKYVPISITKLAAEPAVVEVGSTIDSVKLTWAANKTPVSLFLDSAAQDVNTATITHPLGITPASPTWTKKLTLKAVDERGTESTKSVTLAAHNRVYYGAAAELTLETASVLTGVLSGKKVSPVNVNAAAGEYIWYCLPARMGACSFTVGGFDGGFDLVATMDVPNASGYEESYNIYRSANAGLGSTTVEVK